MKTSLNTAVLLIVTGLLMCGLTSCGPSPTIPPQQTLTQVSYARPNTSSLKPASEFTTPALPTNVCTCAIKPQPTQK